MWNTKIFSQFIFEFYLESVIIYTSFAKNEGLNRNISIEYCMYKHCQHDLGMFFERILNEVMRIRSKSFHDRIKVTNVHPPTGIENEKMHNI